MKTIIKIVLILTIILVGVLVSYKTMDINEDQKFYDTQEAILEQAKSVEDNRLWWEKK
jgi:uncharacterized protein YxeA